MLFVTSTPHAVRSFARIVAFGVAAAVFLALAGQVIERSRLGVTDAESLARVQAELGDRFARTAQALTERARHIAAARDSIRRARVDASDVRRLFELLDAEVPPGTHGTAGVTLFAGATPLAWVGRVSDLPRERIDGPEALFARLDALGPRLVRVQPVADPDRPTGPRLATVVVEERIDGGGDVTSPLADKFQVPTSIVDVAVRVQPGPPDTRSPYTFPIRSAEGQVLVEAEVSPADLAGARARWRAATRSVALGALAVATLMCAAALIDERRRSRRCAAFVGMTAAVAALLLLARGLIWAATMPFIGAALDAPLALIPNALLLGAMVWLALELLERRRLTVPRPPLWPLGITTYAGVALGVGASAAAASAVVWAYARVLQRIAAQSSLDLLHFSLHPLEPVRLSVACGLVLLHAAIIWAAAAILRLPTIAWRTPRSWIIRTVTAVAFGIGSGLFVGMGHRLFGPMPVRPILIGSGAAALLAWLLTRPHGPVRRASQAKRLGLSFLGLLLPALAMYPLVNAFTAQQKERLLVNTYAPQVLRQRSDLKRRLAQTINAIDTNASLGEFVTTSSKDAAPTTDRAFIVWSGTELATYRTTSAVELYGANGRLVSRFALILPEYGTTAARAVDCDDWDLYEEASPFGSTLRPVVRASRAICSNGRTVGTIVVRAMLDYRSLPFRSSQSPYVDALRADRRALSEGRFGGDVSFAAYGWSRAPIYAPETSVWPLPNAIFDRMAASREPLWTEVDRDDELFRVYFFNDSFGIYALGYPLISWIGHLINMGELTFLTGTLFVALAFALAVFNTVTRRSAGSARALLRAVRASFYRKLLWAFVASAVVPFFVLAVATRTYLVNQLLASVEESAVKTATTAQRLVEDYAQQRGTGSSRRVDDQFMVLVRWAIDQDANLFEGTQLQATSERDLFASHLLPSRTPSGVYRSIILDRLPTSVGVEDIGGLPYLLAAAPVRTGGRQGIVTVPQPLRSEEIERQRDELDRRVLSTSVLFVLLAAGLGYWMAERIADPVSRLTRATRRIARGDLDARIAATSSDELRRLVDDFNQMADDLKRQRANLERTQRLEAWADMARQVAHDIKNPLTPIQLSAEHARRVNLDRGRPLSPALDECVNAILSQVQLLRQIAGEFSSFASSPRARLEPTSLTSVIDEVVEPYRVGLEGRVVLDVRAEPNLPLVLIDRTLLGRALTNIIENALHAMPGGGTLRIDSRRSGITVTSPVVVEIADTGAGMDQDALARIFEPYFSTKASGTGLGLTIAKRNVELSAGTIAVASTRGVGTVVTLTLTPATSDGVSNADPAP
jgi:signal transduction histidine kinase